MPFHNPNFRIANRALSASKSLLRGHGTPVLRQFGVPGDRSMPHGQSRRSTELYIQSPKETANQSDWPSSAERASFSGARDSALWVVWRKLWISLRLTHLEYSCNLVCKLSLSALICVSTLFNSDGFPQYVFSRTFDSLL